RPGDCRSSLSASAVCCCHGPAPAALYPLSLHAALPIFSIFRVRCITLIHTATQFQTQYIFNQRAGQAEIGGGVITVFTLLLKGMADAGRTTPVVSHFFGNNVDHTTQGISTV